MGYMSSCLVSFTDRDSRALTFVPAALQLNSSLALSLFDESFLLLGLLLLLTSLFRFLNGQATHPHQEALYHLLGS